MTPYEEEIAIMMLEEDQKIPVIGDSKFKYSLSRATVDAELRPNYKVERVIIDKGKVKIVKVRPISTRTGREIKDNDLIFRIEKVGKMK